jgi:hypothetical protein
MKSSEKLNASIIIRILIAAVALVPGSHALIAQTIPGPQPTICTRACWGARAPACQPGNITSLTRAVVHHTAGPSDWTTDYEGGKSRVRGIQNYHIDSAGFCDISYHFLVNAAGHIYEGRQGAMTGLPKSYHDCCNVNSFGFNVMGYYHPPYNHTFTTASQNALMDVIAWRMPSGWTPYGSGTYCTSTVGKLDGHRKVVESCGPTSCPGDGIYNSFVTANYNGGPIRTGVAARRSGGGGGGVNGHINPTVAMNSNGRQELFAVGMDGALYHTYQTSPNAGWSSWLSMGGTWAQNVSPAVGRNTDGRMEVFVIGSTGQMYNSYQQTAGSSTSWTGWASRGGSFAAYATVACGVNQDGRLELFAIGTGGDLQHNYQTGNGNWSGWSSLGGSWAQNACVRTHNNLDGRMEIFVIGNTGQMYHNYQSAPNGGWVGWSSFGGSFNQASRFAAGRNSDGRLELFAISTGGDLQHLYQTSANGNWYGWSSLGGNWSQDAQPVCALSSDGRLEVFVIGQTGNFYQNYFNGSAWTGWTTLGGSFSQDIRPCIGSNQDGRLELFTTGPGGDMVHDWQNTLGAGSSWSGWYTLGGSWN